MGAAEVVVTALWEASAMVQNVRQGVLLTAMGKSAAQTGAAEVAASALAGRPVPWPGNALMNQPVSLIVMGKNVATMDAAGAAVPV